MADKAFSVGTLREFDHVEMDWEVYSKRLQQYFLANKVKENDQKRAILLTMLTEPTYKLLGTLCYPKKVEETEYNEISEVMNSHFKIAVSVFCQREEFYSAKMGITDDIQNWERKVRSLAVNCDFGDNLLNALRDKFVIDMVKGPIKDKLYSQPVTTLTFKEAVKLALEAEAAYKSKQNQVNQIKTTNNFKKHEQISKGNLASNKIFNKNLKLKCFCCGKQNHITSNCKFKNYSCNKCGFKGHLRKVCKSNISETEHSSSGNRFIETNDCDQLYNISTNNSNPIMLEVYIGNVKVKAELDTGSAVSCISDDFYQENFRNLYQLHPAVKKLISYNGTGIQHKGKCTVKVDYANKSNSIDFYVIKGGALPLLGRDFINNFQISIEINKIQLDDKIERIIKEFPNVFSQEIGTFKLGKGKLYLKDGVKPIYFTPRPLPFAIKEKVEKEIKKLVELKVLEPVKFSDWGTPIVPVLKKNGEVRLCGDYKVTLNQNLKMERYVLPRIEDLFEKLSGGVIFSKIDLTSAYQQILLDKSSQELTTISTHMGLFKYIRCPYGINTLPAIFQRAIESVVGSMKGVGVFLDDISVAGTDAKDHLNKLREVLKRLSDAGLTVNKNKCEFFKKEVEYMGYIISKDGLRVSNKKTDAILQVKNPETVTQLKSFLGMVEYYRRCLPKLSELVSPLYVLLQKDQKWYWNDKLSAIITQVKKMLVSSETLVHYKAEIPVQLTVDASDYGLGANLSHVFENGLVKPIAFASRTLKEAEKNYSQIHKEALAIYWGVKHFHQYVCGREFILQTDAKPLTSIFGSKAGIPQMAANKLQRYALFLSGYDFKIKYINTKVNPADCLSRMPLENNKMEEDEFEELHVKYFEEANFPITVKEIEDKTTKDIKMNKLKSLILNEWPKTVSSEIKVFEKFKDQLHVEKGCIMRGLRVVVPEALQTQILEELHRGHFGIVKTKSLARNYVFWPGIDNDIEKMIKSCYACNIHQSNPSKTVLHPWQISKYPLERVHVDFCGPIQGKYFFVFMDSYSKWPEVVEVPKLTTQITIEVLKDIFSRFGIPEMIVSDNGGAFISQDFKNFCKRNGILHTTIASNNPQSNGFAENGVKLFKKAIAKHLESKINIKQALRAYLFTYRTTPHTSTGETPAKLMFGRTIRTRLEMLDPKQCKPTLDQEVLLRATKTQEKQIKYYGGKQRKSLDIGDLVWSREFRGNKKYWSEGKIVKKVGNTGYGVQLEMGGDRIRHLDQLRKRYIPYDRKKQNEENEIEGNLGFQIQDNVNVETVNRGNINEAEVDDQGEVLDTGESSQNLDLNIQTSQTRPKRVSRLPLKYRDDYVK